MRNRPVVPVSDIFGDHPIPVKANYTISHAPYTGSTVADGTSGPPQYGTPVTRNVFGWYPSAGQASAASSSVASGDDYNLRVITSRVLLVPDTSPYSPLDKVVFPGETEPFFVSRDVRDYTTGPFGYKPGGEVIVEKTSG